MSALTKPQAYSAHARSSAPWSERTPPRYPTSPHAYICQGVHDPCPKKKFDTRAATAPTTNPERRPRAAPATMAMALTGLTSGIGAKSTRPAAAVAARTAVGMSCRNGGRDASKLAKRRPTASTATASVRPTVTSSPAAAVATMTTGTARSVGSSSARSTRGAA